MSESKKIRSFQSGYITTYYDYTPIELREIADKMESNGILSIELEVCHSYENSIELRVSEKRLETDKEYDQRIKLETKEARDRANYKKQQYEALKKEFEG